MAQVAFKGSPVHTNGELPSKGSKAPDILLTGHDLQDLSLKSFQGKKKLLMILPSLDTSVCAACAKKLNEFAKSHPEDFVLIISADLPFAQKRFCTSENLTNIVTLSMMRSKDFAISYGVLLVDGPLKGLCARALLALDAKDIILYAELVSEITKEPDYDKAIEALR